MQDGTSYKPAMTGKAINSNIIVTDKFYSEAKALREHFMERMQDPKDTRSDRFVWDYWHVPDQYTLIRTPAYHYFPDEMYMKFHEALVDWGRKNLGCWDISPPWLSYYVDGCKQELHSDVPHGPWAYVYSLTPEERKFSGGETLVVKPEVLSYWKNFGDQEDREFSSFVDRVSADFNRLVVFDPRFPHGVTPVYGTRDPREARLVIHGWFMEPKTYLDGPLPDEDAENKLNDAFDRVQEVLSDDHPVTGTVSVRLMVKKDGTTRDVRFGTNTLVDENGNKPEELSQALLEIYSKINFQACDDETEMTVPLIFG